VLQARKLATLPPFTPPAVRPTTISFCISISRSTPPTIATRADIKKVSSQVGMVARHAVVSPC
jgi:hypothetical protein